MATLKPQNDPEEIKKRLLAVSASINKSQGEGTVYSLGKSDCLNIRRWSTGIEDLDNIIGGGMPCGRVVEIFGGEGAGKTTLCYHLMARQMYSIDIPIEGTFDPARARVFGNTPSNLLICRAKYGEEAMSAICQYIPTGVPLICLDSVPSCIPKEDIEKMAKAVKNGEEFDNRMGGIPRLMGKYLHEITVKIEQYDNTLIFVNQIRDKMNAMMFGEKTDTPGGHLLRHMYSLRLQVARKGWIEIPNKNPAITATTEKVGMVMKIKVVKSKVSNPMGECEIPLFFDRGFVSWDDVEEIRKSLMSERKEQYRN